MGLVINYEDIEGKWDSYLRDWKLCEAACGLRRVPGRIFCEAHLHIIFGQKSLDRLRLMYLARQEYIWREWV